MQTSLFQEYVKSLWPKLSLFVKEKVNGNNKPLTYLHKEMLDKVYSLDQKWEGTTANTTYVAADMVAMDSPLSVKKRDSMARSSGKLPKIGMKKKMKESDINAINIMKAQLSSSGDDEQRKSFKLRILKKIIDDPYACSVGIDEKNEANFLTALSDGVILVEDEENVGLGLRVDYGFLPQNCFGVTTKGEVEYDDIKRVIQKADDDGNSIQQICIALSTYNKLRQTRWAKELVANFKGQTFTSDTALPVPTAKIFDEAFADDNNGISFKKIDRSVIFEKNGKRTATKPFSKNKLTFICQEKVGSLVWGTLAEDTNRVAGVEYTTVDDYKLISRYSKTDPLEEFTNGQALVLPVIEDVDAIYSLDLDNAYEVDEDAEAADNADTYVTINGNKYTKAGVINVLKSMGVSVRTDASDNVVIKKVNELNDDDESKFFASVEVYKI